MSVKLHDHQVEAVAKMHNGCVLYGDVGVGKTITSLGYYVDRVCGGEINAWGSMTTPKDVYVITTAKVRDSKGFELQAALYGIHKDRDISTNGVSITVDSWNNLHKYVGVKGAFFIFDEQRVVGYGAWSRAFIKIAKENEWILLSATPGDTWMDYIPVFIANGWYKHKTDFIDQHVIWTPRVKFPKVLRYQNVGKLVRQRNQVLVHMPYKRHTVRHLHDVICSYDEEAFDKVVNKRWHVFEKRPLRDVAELFSVMRRVVNSDASRLTAVSNLLEKHPKLIVFYNFDYELEALRTVRPGSTGLSGTTSSTSTGASQRSSKTTAGSTSPSTSSDRSLPSSSALRSPSSSSHKMSSYLSSPESSTSSSLTSSDTGSTPTSRSDWDYLLSPEGLAANHLEAPNSTTAPATTGKTDPATSAATLSATAGTGTTEEEACKNVSSPTTRGGSSSSAESKERLSTSQSGKSSTGDSERKTTGTTQSGSSFAVAEWNGHKHEEIPTTDGWLYLVQYRAGAEGWNCIETDAICFYSQTYSYRDFFQAHGRIDRLNTPFTNLHYYYLFSRSVIDKAIRGALKVKKNFNERDLKL